MCATGPDPNRILRLALSLLTATALLMTPLRSAADSPWLYGIHWYGEPVGSQVEAMTGGKGIWSLETVQTNSDLWWSAAWQRDYRFNTMVQRGHALIVRIERNWGETVPFPQNVPAYLISVQQAAAELASVAHIWQVGNEMNILAEWGGQVLTPQQYVDTFRQVRSAIKSVASPLGEQVVLIGPVSPGDLVPGVRHTGGAEYLSAVCALLDPNDFDGFALHAYAAPWHGVADSRGEFQAGYLTQLAVLREHGFAGRPVHLTEWARSVEPLTAASEAVSAQFLQAALVDLHGWNTLPLAQPITAACWFIYPYDSGAWQSFSIGFLRTLHPPGAANDLWDAFHAAAAMNLPAGVAAPVEEPTTAAVPFGANIAAAAGVTTSSGNGALAVDGVVSVASKWTSAPTPGPHWLTLEWPTPRRLTGFIVRHAGAAGENPAFNTTAFAIQTRLDAADPWRVDLLTYNGAGSAATARAYVQPRLARFVRLLIVDPGVDTYARIPEFEVYAAPMPGDFDQNGVIDETDLLYFEFCAAGPGVAFPLGHLCLAGDFDGDLDLDMADWAAFQFAYGGP